MGARRLFLGLLLPPELQREAARRVGAALEGCPGLRLPRADGLHLTLVFLGETGEQRRTALEGELDRRLAGAAAPRLRLGRAGAFPSMRRPRVLWIGAEEQPAGAGHLEVLQRLALDAAGSAGCDVVEERRRPYRPHLTVARVEPRGSRAGVPGTFAALDLDLPWRPERVELLESVRAGDGPPRYVSLRGWPLARTGP